LGHFELTLGMRLHFLVFSALAGVPFLGLPYSEKVAAFLDEFGLCAPALESTTAGQLIAAVDRAWQQRDELGRRMGATLERLMVRARQNDRVLHALVGDRGAGAAAASP
jgi:polysaccharide pyruvyl transferase WcaK-like protein